MGEQQGIAGQERRYHQSGLGENDQEDDAVDPGVVQRDHVGQVPVQVQEGIEQEMHWIRRCRRPAPRRSRRPPG